MTYVSKEIFILLDTFLHFNYFFWKLWNWFSPSVFLTNNFLRWTQLFFVVFYFTYLLNVEFRMRNDFWIRNTKKCSATLSEWISWFILFLQLWYAVVTHLFVTATSYNVTDFFVKTIMLHLLFIMFRGIKMSKKILDSKIMQVELETVIRH